MATREYRSLKQNIGHLKSQFLNFEKRIDGKYTKNELAGCRAYVTFAHAEFEQYFEEIADRLLTKAKKDWKRSKYSSKILLCLVAFINRREGSNPNNISNPKPEQKISYMINYCIGQHSKIIKSNNGIKQKDLGLLLYPLSVDESYFSEALAIQLDNFGSRRGAMVHLGTQISISTIRDPFSDEDADIAYLLNEIESFDKMVSRIR